MVSSTIQGGGGSVRGVRDQFQSGTILGVLPGKGKGVPIKRLTLTQIATAIANNGGLPLPSAGSITSAMLDAVFGSTEGNILQRGASVWQVLAPGTAGQVLTSGGAAALNAWMAASGGTTIADTGPWNNTAGYSIGNVVQWLSSSYLCYSPVASAIVAAAQWNPGDATAATISTTNTTNDTFTSTGGGYANSLTNGKTSGKWYYEFVPSGVLSNNSAVGASTAAFAAFIGGSALGQFLDNFAGGSSGGSWAGLASTKRNAVALDLLHNNFWITADVTASPIIWNGSSLNLPATNTGGYPLGSSPLTQVFQNTYCPTTAGQVVVLYTASASLLIPVVPTGFSIWGAGAAVPNISPDLDITHWVAQGNQNPANLNEHALLGGV